MTDASVENEELEDDENLDVMPLLDFSELPDNYLLSDKGKTERIQELEQEVASLTRQLTESKNLVNTLYSEIDRYKRVNGQVGWLIEQFRNTISGSDIKTRSRPLPPPPTPPPFLSVAEEEDSEATEPSEVADSVADEAEDEEVYGEAADGEDLNEDDAYSEDWETTEEADDQVPSVSIIYDRETPEPRAARDPTPIPSGPLVPTPLVSDPDTELNALLATATPQTLISEIYRRWKPPSNASPPPP